LEDRRQMNLNTLENLLTESMQASIKVGDVQELNMLRSKLIALEFELDEIVKVKDEIVKETNVVSQKRKALEESTKEDFDLEKELKAEYVSLLDFADSPSSLSLLRDSLLLLAAREMLT
ncbi:hypothetical protein HAX54_050487, partial [Datura stramonium]|nr:hypothetical protein [Datura stramonium]